MYSIDIVIRDYIYNLLMNNKYLLLDWDRNTGKTKYCMSCVFEYALNNPNSYSVCVSTDIASTLVLKQKIMLSNNVDFIKQIKQHTSRHIFLKNDSIIEFNPKLKDITHKVDLMFVDEFFYKRPSFFDHLMKYDSKLLFNYTSNENNKYNNEWKQIISSLDDLIILNNVTHDTVLNYLRRSKINKIKDSLQNRLLEF